MIHIERQLSPEHQKLESVFEQLQRATGANNDPTPRQKTSKMLPCDQKVLTPEEAMAELRSLGIDPKA